MIVACPQAVVVEPERRPDRGLHGRIVETSWHHADHHSRGSIEPHLAADDLRIGTEATAPESIAEHDHALRFGRVLLGEKCPPDLRRDGEYSEEAVGDSRRYDSLGLPCAGEIP